MKKMKKYQITMTEEQARLISDALDLYTRMGLGQFEKIVDVYDQGYTMGDYPRARLRDALDGAKVAAGHPINGSHGIHNPQVRRVFRSAFDLQQVIRNRLAWDRTPKGGNTVDFDEPEKIGEHDLPTIKLVVK